MIVSVKILNGPECSVTLVDTSTVSELKEQVSFQLGVPISLQKIVYKGRTLSNEKTVGEHGVEDGAKVHLLVAPVKIPQLAAGATAAEVPGHQPEGGAKGESVLLWSQLQALLLRHHYSEMDSMRVTVDFYKELGRMLDTLGLDDFDRLAASMLEADKC